jgi:hypothetical protein
MESHCHKALWDTVAPALSRYGPGARANRIRGTGRPRSIAPSRERWVLDLHDAIDNDRFHLAQIAHRFEQECSAHTMLSTVCSEEDRAGSRFGTRTRFCVPNASSIEIGNYRPSDSSQLLFMGPIPLRTKSRGRSPFLCTDAFPKIRSAISHARIAVLGGDGAHTRVSQRSRFHASPASEVFRSITRRCRRVPRREALTIKSADGLSAARRSK